MFVISPSTLLHCLLFRQIDLQRNTIDIGGGSGTLTVGKLPDGITDDQITWVPVRLYSPEEGGAASPSFAPNENYPSFVFLIPTCCCWLTRRQSLGNRH